jgi:hypothetical protein
MTNPIDTIDSYQSLGDVDLRQNPKAGADGGDHGVDEAAAAHR